VTFKPLIRRASARRDEQQAVQHYASEAGLDLALRFNKALRAAYSSIVERPKAGSPRFGEMLGFEGLRTRRLRTFPFVVFYIEKIDAIHVWRVLHAQRDVEAALRRNEDS
jgi:toxin ParE1/3/4